MINPANTPAPAKEMIDNYVKHRIPPGGFMEAVISNDLMGAVGRADATNIRALPEIVSYLFNYCPAACWGSKEKMTAWLEKKDDNA